MKAKIALIGGAAAGCMAIAGCGGGSHLVSSPVTPPPTTTVLETNTVLQIVQSQTSETAQPFQVDNGVVVFAQVDDSTAPTVVDGT